MIFTDKIQKAIRFSIKTHEVYQKQKRKGKDIPYITHPLIVGLILARADVSEDVVIAGILHDTIEDSIPEKKVTKAMLAERFGDTVAGIVDDVTEQDKDLPWQERKQEALEHIEKLQNDSLLVKSADLISNISEIIADHQVEGDIIFKRFNAPKEKIIAHYMRMVTAVVHKWPENPLINDLRGLDIMSMDPDQHSLGVVGALWRRDHKGDPMAFVSTHGKTRDEVVNEVLQAVEHPSHRAVSFSGEEYLPLLKIVASFTEKGSVEAEPKFVLVTGGVAAGKTTIRRQKYATGYVNFEYGEIYTAVKREVGTDHPRLEVYVNVVCDLILRETITEKKNLVVEIIGDNYEKLVPLIDKMVSVGYKVEMVGITADPVEAYQRHLKAVKEDPDYISAHFTQDATMAALYAYLELPSNPV